MWLHTCDEQPIFTISAISTIAVKMASQVNLAPQHQEHGLGLDADGRADVMPDSCSARGRGVATCEG